MELVFCSMAFASRFGSGQRGLCRASDLSVNYFDSLSCVSFVFFFWLFTYQHHGYNVEIMFYEFVHNSIRVYGNFIQLDSPGKEGGMMMMIDSVSAAISLFTLCP